MPQAQPAIVERIARLLRERLPESAPSLAAPSLPGCASALTALALRKLHPRSWIVLLCAGQGDMERLQGDLRTFGGPEADILPLPPPEDDPDHHGDLEIEGIRLAVARRLGRSEDTNAPPPLLVTSPAGLLAPLPEGPALSRAARRLNQGEKHDFIALTQHCVAVGYDRQDEVVVKGQMAVRGGLLDIWAPSAPLPLRIEFFGNEIEAIRSFDPATQRSVKAIEQAWLPPCKQDAVPSSPPGERLPAHAVVLWLEHDHLAAVASALPLPDNQATDGWNGLRRAVDATGPRLQVFTGDPPPAAMPTLDVTVAPPPGLAAMARDPLLPDLQTAARQKLLDGMRQRAEQGEEVWIFLDTAGGCEWLARDLDAAPSLRLRQGMLSGGCAWPDLDLTILGQPDLYALHKKSGRRLLPEATASRGGRIERAGELRPGELVVHLDHGIGRFEGLQTIETHGRRVEMLTVRYADNARLHVPTAQTHLLSRYVGSGGREPPLHRLGGRRWQSERLAAERAVVDLASSLLEIQARRSLRKGLAFDVNPPWMHAFDAAFPYRETPDQERCIEEVKRDLAAPRPMDRLVCGDAGYGKTEVAMRAAFIAVMNGKQVAVLAPTTVLAEQHYETFGERMAAFPIRIEVLSRFRSPSRRNAIITDLAEGRIDIVIGTHALVQPRVRFHDLGLVVIDEEQRFGVAHKEKLKQVRAEVDVLTLSATPIPRTLYMSMTGARDMSLLQTPPQERLAIETRIERDHDAVIRNAIHNELGRDGQVYFLHNRVMTIDLMLGRLRRIVPGARIAVAHGQQSPGELSGTMRRFESGEIDVLLCTTIIESGLDIPRANTIIVHRADRFGLADLYQLRGRVGRSVQRGFAYLLLPSHGHLDEDARQRMGALRRHGGLGGGFNLALRDLEIRGAGNMLGSEQSGHIAAVGFSLYCQLLRRTVARLQGQRPPKLVDTNLQLDFFETVPGGAFDDAAGLPRGYIEDDPQRIHVYRRLAETSTSHEVRAIRRELTDRYGKPPPATERLLLLTEIRIVAAARDIVRVETREGVVRLFLRNGQPITLPDGKLPRLQGRSVDQHLASLMRILKRL